MADNERSDAETDATRRTRAALAAAARVLAKCAATDPTIPRPNQATAAAWAEHIVAAGLQDSTELLLAAVTQVYSTPHGDGFRLRPWHVITAAKELREEAAMRESDARRQARQDARDAAIAAVEDAAELAAAVDGMVPISGGASPFIVACRHDPCRAGVGQPCTTSGRRGGRVVSYSRAHPNRIERAAAERQRDSPEARRAAAEATRADAQQAVSRYRERHQREADEAQ